MDFSKVVSWTIPEGNVKKVWIGQQLVWQAKVPYLRFTAVENNSSVALVAVGAAPAVTLKKSFDGVNWDTYSVGETIELNNVGDFVYFAAGTGGNTKFASSSGNYNKFSISGKVSASGDISSIRDFNLSHAALTNFCYAKLFYNCSGLTSAPELPATTLATSCYENMFYGCTSLTSAPKLPATKIAQSCYAYMFRGCTGLTSAPALPATTLAFYCYRYMFYGCTSLTSAPELPATTLTYYCYQYMFYNCTSLTSAPELPATTLTTSCYEYMFRGCTSLKSIKVHFSAWSQTTSWVQNVPAGGTFYKPSALPATYGTSNIPSGWTVVNID